MELQDCGNGLRLPSGEVISYEQVLADLERLREISPLDFWDPYGVQADFAASGAKRRLVCGGNRSGKTESVAAYVVRKCLEKKNQRWWCVAETFGDSVAVQQAKVAGLVPKHEIKYGSYDVINGYTNRKLLFKNGSLIIFKSYDQSREAFQGDQVNGAWCDEECPYDIYQEIKMRLIDRDGELVISMTSLKGVTELVDELYTDCHVIKSEYAPLVDEVLPRIARKGDTDLFFLWTTENPYLPADRVLAETALMDRQEIKSRIYGIPINLSGRIYVKFSRLVHVVPGIDQMPEGRYTLFNILDPHDSHPWAMVWIALHATGTAYVVDEYPERPFGEIEYDDKTYDDYSKIIKAKEADLKEIFGEPVRRRIIDPNFGNKTVQLAVRQGHQSTTTPKKTLARLGLNYVDAIDALEAGHLKVREWIHWDEKDGEIVVQPRLLILEHCTNTITAMSRYSYKDPATAGGDVKEKVGPQEKYKHFPDLLRYFVMSNPRQIDEYKEPEYKRMY